MQQQITSLFTPRAVAERLNIGERTARALLAQGEIPGAIRVGARLRIDPAALENWIRAGGRAPARGCDE